MMILTYVKSLLARAVLSLVRFAFAAEDVLEVGSNGQKVQRSILCM